MVILFVANDNKYQAETSTVYTTSCLPAISCIEICAEPMLLSAQTPDVIVTHNIILLLQNNEREYMICRYSMLLINLGMKEEFYYVTWDHLVNFNPSVVKLAYSLQIAGCNYVSIPKLKRCNAK